MFKRILMISVLGLAGTVVAPSRSDAGIFFRPVAPVRRVAARAVLPPYPVTRRVVAAPLYRPIVSPIYPAYGSVMYGAPYPYGGIVIGY